MISIVTSLYKSEKYLPKFFKSVKKVHTGLKKNKIHFEHIIIANDISKEETELIKKSVLNFKLITTPRETLYASWNRGVENSIYKYTTFWSVDDFRFTYAFINGIKKLENGYDATYFPYIYKRYVWILGIKILAMIKIVNPIKYNRELFIKGMYAGPHFIFRKSIFETNGTFNETFKIAGDFDWWSRLAKNNFKIIKTCSLSGIFNNDGRTLSGSKNSLQKKENETITNSQNI